MNKRLTWTEKGFWFAVSCLDASLSAVPTLEKLPLLDSVEEDSSRISFGGVSGTDSPSPYQKIGINKQSEE